jgi:hypothetical protein
LGQMIYAMLQLTSGMGKLLAMVEHDSGWLGCSSRSRLTATNWFHSYMRDIHVTTFRKEIKDGKVLMEDKRVTILTVMSWLGRRVCYLFLPNSNLETTC